jgi:arginyl-tRNA synthetase
MNIRRLIEHRVRAAMVACGAAEGTPAMVMPAGKPQFGDYQANGIMAAAKGLKTNPRQLAQQVIAHDSLADVAEKVEVAGPGFINIFLRGDWLDEQLAAMTIDERLGVEKAWPQTVVVDYSGPNLAKEMHVGHLRSTIIGDALARVLEFLGHQVIRQNHVGDWGTQFGMLIAHMQTSDADADASLADLEEFYRQAKKRFDDESDFADLSRQYVVRLQGGDAKVLEAWRKFVSISMRHCQEVYDRLGVSLGAENVRGESAYNDDLAGVVAELDKAGLLRESQGAKVVFLEQFTGKDDEPLPLIVQKSDGGYLYATTDLAAIRYRAGELGADRVLYVTDSRQSLHFAQVFAVAKAAGLVGDDVSLEHIAFGTMLGPDGKPFKTRTGGTVKLVDLIDQARQRALALVSEKNPDLAEDQQADIAQAVGVGAVKYADLAQNRSSDYVFSFDRMLSLEGNTAPYMQYAYARVRSIFRKGAEAAGKPGDIHVLHEAERALGVKLLQLQEALETVAIECLPNVLCGYLYDLAGAFMVFYENCPVLKADSDAARASRLALCQLTADVIRRGLGLLGIETIEQM